MRMLQYIFNAQYRRYNSVYNVLNVLQTDLRDVKNRQKV